MPDDSPTADSGIEMDDSGLDELVEPSVELRTAQERERAEPANDASDEPTPSHGDELEADARDGVDELVEPSGGLRTAQEQEQDQAIDEDGGGGGDA